MAGACARTRPGIAMLAAPAAAAPLMMVRRFMLMVVSSLMRPLCGRRD